MAETIVSYSVTLSQAQTQACGKYVIAMRDLFFDLGAYHSQCIFPEETTWERWRYLWHWVYHEHLWSLPVDGVIGCTPALRLLSYESTMSLLFALLLGQHIIPGLCKNLPNRLKNPHYFEVVFGEGKALLNALMPLIAAQKTKAASE